MQLGVSAAAKWPLTWLPRSSRCWMAGWGQQRA